MRKIILLVALLFLTVIPASAITGCLVGTNLYTNNVGSSGGVAYYNFTPSTDATGFCLRNGTSTTPCQWGFFWGSSWINFGNGTLGDYGPPSIPDYCPIDDYVPLLIVVFALFGFCYIKNLKMRHLLVYTAI